jgi:glycosyltransferase involved in cell wall biosynthesis
MGVGELGEKHSMTRDPRVSVVMSVHNDQNFIAEAITSILSQTFGDFEFIIIDDGSQDSSKAIIESFGDPRIRLISRPNKGLTLSLNEGIEAARGEYIARQDADDISLPERFEQEVDYLDAHPAVGMVGTNYIIIDESGRYLDQTRSFLHPRDLALAEPLSNQFGHGSVMFRRAVLEEVGLYDPRLPKCEDYDLFCRLTHVTQLANVAQALYKWRRRATGLSFRDGDAQITQERAIRDREFERILENRRRYPVYRSLHPFGFYPGPLHYLDRKSRLYRDLAWLYHRRGYRRQALVAQAVAAIHAPWRKRNFRYFRRLLLARTADPLWEYEYI